jgi:hypothetical protein
MDLLELFHNQMQSDLVRFVDGPESKRAYEQLMGLETEFRESGTVYTCPPGQHDDLGISCAMLAWAARHPHVMEWVRIFERSPIVRKRKPQPSPLCAQDLRPRIANLRRETAFSQPNAAWALSAAVSIQKLTAEQRRLKKVLRGKRGNVLLN